MLKSRQLFFFSLLTGERGGLNASVAIFGSQIYIPDNVYIADDSDFVFLSLNFMLIILYALFIYFYIFVHYLSRLLYDLYIKVPVCSFFPTQLSPGFFLRFKCSHQLHLRIAKD